MQQTVQLPDISSNYLKCGCHAHTTTPPFTFFNIHLHKLLSEANNKQVNELFNFFQTDINRILLSQFIDRITLQTKLTYDQQHYYFNTFNQIMKNNNNSDLAEIESDDDGILSNLSDLEQELDTISEYNECNTSNEYIYELPDNVWSRVFQFVDEKTHILSLPLCSTYIYSISTSPFSWISLQINCSHLYFNFKKSYLFSNFLLKSGRCLTTLVLRDIASMNELHWKHFISFLTYCCPKILNVRIRSSMTQNNINNDKKYTKKINKTDINSIFYQLIGSNLHMH
eukprot:490056_1